MSGRLAPLDPNATSIDNECYHGFGDGWWDPAGPAAGLHEVTPVRHHYFDDTFRRVLGERASKTAKIIDVGCGGGVLTESMARAGYDITGFDVSESSLAAARRHAKTSGVAVTYRSGSAYELGIPSASVDGVIISDVLEHLHDLDRASKELARVLKPGGLVVFDTINRTFKSYLLMIVAAERLLGMIPNHTHDWRMFICPDELRSIFGMHGLDVQDLHGMNPADSLPKVFRSVWKQKRFGTFELSADLAVSYIGYAVRKAT